jgi:ferredoxin-nitrate reductase
VVTAGLRSVRDQIGPGAVAIAASDGETCETYLQLARFARLVVGTDHLDTPARLDALPAYDACERAFGVPANPASVEDIDATSLVVMIGGDATESHPGLYYRILDVRRTNRAKVILVDSRKTLAAAIADVHVRPAPGAEIAAVNALAAEALGAPSAGAARAAFEAAGGTRVELDAMAAAWRAARGVVTVIGPGALSTVAGAALADAVARLHVSTNQWGGLGRGVLFLPRGANATGVLACGVRPGRLPAGGRLDSAADRARFTSAWGASPEALPAEGLPLLAWPTAVGDGRLGALLALRVNPAAEFPDALAWRAAMTRAFTVVASTHVPSESTVFADVVLPLALVAGESNGTMMTLDRRCQLLEAATAPPGEARTADQLLRDLARPFAGTGALADSFGESAAEWERWREISRGTKLDASGISGERLRKELDVAWPCAAETEPGAVRIAAGAVVARAWSSVPAPRHPAVSAERPLLLIVGPVLEHDHSRMRTGRTPELHYEAPVPQLEMNPIDGSALAIPDGEWVTVESTTGAATARLWLTDRVAPGTVFLPEHFGFLSDLQGGSATLEEPEGLANLVVPGSLASTDAAPAGLPVPVSVRKSRRRDMRQRGI